MNAQNFGCSGEVAEARKIDGNRPEELASGIFVVSSQDSDRRMQQILCHLIVAELFQQIRQGVIPAEIHARLFFRLLQKSRQS